MVLKVMAFDANGSMSSVNSYNRKGVFFQPHHSRRVLRGSALRQDRETAAASDTSGDSDKSCHNGTQGPGALTTTQTPDIRSVTSGPNVNSLPLEKNVESNSIVSTDDYDRV
jgi:hypothetical protein